MAAFLPGVRMLVTFSLLMVVLLCFVQCGSSCCWSKTEWSRFATVFIYRPRSCLSMICRLSVKDGLPVALLCCMLRWNQDRILYSLSVWQQDEKLRTFILMKYMLFFCEHFRCFCVCDGMGAIHAYRLLFLYKLSLVSCVYFCTCKV